MVEIGQLDAKRGCLIPGSLCASRLRGRGKEKGFYPKYGYLPRFPKYRGQAGIKEHNGMM